VTTTDPRPRVLVLRAAGTNCDRETAHAFERAGATTGSLHVNRLRERPDLLDGYHALAIPGGFTYGDDVAAGRILANELRLVLAEPIARFLAAGKLVLGICNGFQALVKAGLIPRFGGEGGQRVTLAANDSNRFEARWVIMEGQKSRSPLVEEGERLPVPVAHAEGKLLADGPETLDRMEQGGLIAFKYAGPDGGEPTYPWNPNGSERAIAGACDETGLVLGLMPHPERNVAFHHGPTWTRTGPSDPGAGLRIFERAVRYCRRTL